MIRVGVPIPTVGRLPALRVNIERLKQQRGLLRKIKPIMWLAAKMEIIPASYYEKYIK
jgi:hypothetical protein